MLRVDRFVTIQDDNDDGDDGKVTYKGHSAFFRTNQKQPYSGVEESELAETFRLISS